MLRVTEDNSKIGKRRSFDITSRPSNDPELIIRLLISGDVLNSLVFIARQTIGVNLVNADLFAEPCR